MKKFFKYVLKYPKLILILSLIITIAFFVVMRQNTSMETDLDDYMPQDHPAFVYSNRAEDWFDIKDGIIIAIENNNGIYNQSTLEKVKSLTKKLQSMEEIDKDDVKSLYTSDNIVGTEFGLDVKPFFKKVPQNHEEMITLRNNVRDNEMVYERLVNKDETVTLIIAEIGEDTFSQ
ncbi:MAG: hypothetical protein KGY74_09700, partial [Candidatus Cloacimonetes bacterium]|nr:hypothetical protein [Candidatus Cloacimonadota bacterium]